MLALSQVLPGPNVVNLALMLGDRFFGLRGAVAARRRHARSCRWSSSLALTARLRRVLARSPLVAGALRGMGAVAAGLVIATAHQADDDAAAATASAGRSPARVRGRSPSSTIAWLRWPLVWVVAGLGTLGGRRSPYARTAMSAAAHAGAARRPTCSACSRTSWC